MKNKFIAIETTYPNLKAAKNLAKILLDKKLAACVHLMPIESLYCWQKKIQNDKEILVKIKTKNSLYKAVEKTIKEHHSYEIPQILATQINQGFAPYLSWIDSNVKQGK